MEEIQIFTPPVADQTNTLEFSLIVLTEAIAQMDPAALARGFLGGEFGYGADWDNDVFMMHPYCSCEKRDCLWCTIWLSNEEDCTEADADAHREKQIRELESTYGKGVHQAPHFWHKKSGLQVRWYKWIGRDMEILNETNVDIAGVFRECMQSLTAIRTP